MAVVANARVGVMPTAAAAPPLACSASAARCLTSVSCFSLSLAWRMMALALAPAGSSVTMIVYPAYSTTPTMPEISASLMAVQMTAQTDRRVGSE